MFASEYPLMVTGLTSIDVILPLLLVKAALAILAVLLFAYYKFYWEKAKRHLSVPYFYAKWRAVKHAFILGFAALGFAIGFSLELFGLQMGLDVDSARIISSVFELGSLFVMLYMSLTLTLEDVPHFQHIAEEAERAKGMVRTKQEKKAGAGAAHGKKRTGRKKRSSFLALFGQNATGGRTWDFLTI